MRPAAPAAAEISLQTSDNWPSEEAAEQRVKQELRQLPGAHAAREHVMGAEPEHADHAAGGQKMAKPVSRARARVASRAAP